MHLRSQNLKQKYSCYQSIKNLHRNKLHYLAVTRGGKEEENQ